MAPWTFSGFGPNHKSTLFSFADGFRLVLLSFTWPISLWQDLAWATKTRSCPDWSLDLACPPCCKLALKTPDGKKEGSVAVCACPTLCTNTPSLIPCTPKWPIYVYTVYIVHSTDYRWLGRKASVLVLHIWLYLLHDIWAYMIYVRKKYWKYIWYVICIGCCHICIYNHMNIVVSHIYICVHLFPSSGFRVSALIWISNLGFGFGQLVN